ncbi:MAG: hypothetical protein R2758_15580 [Bacteroidales bacterium]
MVNIRRITPIPAITSTFSGELMSLRRCGPAIMPVNRYPIIAGTFILVKMKFTKGGEGKDYDDILQYTQFHAGQSDY